MEAKNGDTVSIRSCWTFGFSDLRVFLAVLRKIQTLRETGGLATAGEYYDITLVPSDVETLWDLDRGGSQRNSIRTSLERLQTMFVKIEFGDRSCEARMKEWRKKAVLMVLENDESMEKLSGEAPDTQCFPRALLRGGTETIRSGFSAPCFQRTCRYALPTFTLSCHRSRRRYGKDVRIMDTGTAPLSDEL